MPAREDELGGLWLKTSRDGKEFMSGKINGQEVVVFRNEYKKPGERSPDWRVYRSQPRDAAAPPPSERAQTAARGGYDNLDDEIPFAWAGALILPWALALLGGTGSLA